MNGAFSYLLLSEAFFRHSICNFNILQKSPIQTWPASFPRDFIETYHISDLWGCVSSVLADGLRDTDPSSGVWTAKIHCRLIFQSYCKLEVDTRDACCRGIVCAWGNTAALKVLRKRSSHWLLQKHGQAAHSGIKHTDSLRLILRNEMFILSMVWKLSRKHSVKSQTLPGALAVVYYRVANPCVCECVRDKRTPLRCQVPHFSTRSCPPVSERLTTWINFYFH